MACHEYGDPGLRRLRSPAEDAEALGRVLRDGAIGGYDVRTLVNQPAHVVNQALDDFFADRSPDDLLLVHFSCHGVKDEDGRLHFATPDTRLGRLDSTSVSADLVNRLMGRSRSRRIVLFLDCCYAGAFARGMVARGGTALPLREQLAGRGRAVITASSAMEYAFEGGGEPSETSPSPGPSVFTGALVAGLESGEADRDQDGWVTLDELYDHLYESVRAVTRHQTPGKWAFGVQGGLRLARRGRPVETPAPLPPELADAIGHPLAGIRAGAAQELGRLLAGRHAGRALAARRALQGLAEDDSRTVSAAAAALLAAHGGHEERRAAPADPADAAEDPAPQDSSPPRTDQADQADRAEVPDGLGSPTPPGATARPGPVRPSGAADPPGAPVALPSPAGAPTARRRRGGRTRRTATPPAPTAPAPARRTGSPPGAPPVTDRPRAPAQKPRGEVPDEPGKQLPPPPRRPEAAAGGPPRPGGVATGHGSAAAPGPGGAAGRRRPRPAAVCVPALVGAALLLARLFPPYFADGSTALVDDRWQGPSALALACLVALCGAAVLRPSWERAAAGGLAGLGCMSVVGGVQAVAVTLWSLSPGWGMVLEIAAHGTVVLAAVRALRAVRPRLSPWRGPGHARAVTVLGVAAAAGDALLVLSANEFLGSALGTFAAVAALTGLGCALRVRSRPDRRTARRCGAVTAAVLVAEWIILVSLGFDGSAGWLMLPVAAVPPAAVAVTAAATRVSPRAFGLTAVAAWIAHRAADVPLWDRALVVGGHPPVLYGFAAVLIALAVSTAGLARADARTPAPAGGG
ncbi:caspase family protein [Streptomyces sp. C10-9-1]|uniref:caspase, EACC1-associated type n=1 Tax=Streptomyces sp. C10-9-1 TaxID=1859285 RepID=UPI0021134B12|nr:caspase family protein [Streptomyces sp. C10-9-1]MCQ6553922.1 caspase family protein [Streptomyces sp. C10-9-1]